MARIAYICTIGGFLKHAKYWSNLQKHYKYAQTQQLDRSICIDKATLKSDLFNYACNEQQSQNEFHSFRIISQCVICDIYLFISVYLGKYILCQHNNGRIQLYLMFYVLSCLQLTYIYIINDRLLEYVINFRFQM